MVLERTPPPSVHTPQWCNGFLVDGARCGPIRLEQVDRTTFALRSTIEYLGDTGLDDAGLSPEVLERIRTLDPSTTSDGRVLTDLASVPQPVRWFLGAYGEHTPAVLIHDWLIPAPADLEGLTDAHVDRYMRFMLEDLGMRWLKRWIMWSAVALRTRFAAGGGRRLSVIAWATLAVVGISAGVVGLLRGDMEMLVAAAVLPLPSALLWGRQWAAGLVAAVAAPWLLPPTVLAVLGYAVYLVLERIGSWLRPAAAVRDETGTYRPSGV